MLASSGFCMWSGARGLPNLNQLPPLEPLYTPSPKSRLRPDYQIHSQGRYSDPGSWAHHFKGLQAENSRPGEENGLHPSPVHPLLDINMPYFKLYTLPLTMPSRTRLEIYVQKLRVLTLCVSQLRVRLQDTVIQAAGLSSTVASGGTGVWASPQEVRWCCLHVQLANLHQAWFDCLLDAETYFTSFSSYICFVQILRSVHAQNFLHCDPGAGEQFIETIIICCHSQRAGAEHGFWFISSPFYQISDPGNHGIHTTSVSHWLMQVKRLSYLVGPPKLAAQAKVAHDVWKLLHMLLYLRIVSCLLEVYLPQWRNQPTEDSLLPQ